MSNADMTNAPEWAQELAANQERMNETLDNILAKFDEIAGEVKPLIEKVSSHPMLRMLMK